MKEVDDGLFIEMCKPEVVGVHYQARQDSKTLLFQSQHVFSLAAFGEKFYYVDQLAIVSILFQTAIDTLQFLCQLGNRAENGPQFQYFVNYLPSFNYIEEVFRDYLCDFFEFIYLFRFLLQFELQIGFEEDVISMWYFDHIE